MKFHAGMRWQWRVGPQPLAPHTLLSSSIALACFAKDLLHKCISLLGLQYQNITGWAAWTTEIDFLIVLEAWSLRSRCWRIGSWWEFPSWLADDCLLAAPIHAPSSEACGEKELSHLFLCTSAPLHYGPTLMSSHNIYYLLKALPPNPVNMEVKTSMCGFERDAIQSVMQGCEHSSLYIAWQQGWFFFFFDCLFCHLSGLEVSYQ